MKENDVIVQTMSESEAANLTAANQNGYVWPSGMHIIVDNSRAILETREEAEELAAQIIAAADKLWTACKNYD